jgi:hypothetical protein
VNDVVVDDNTDDDNSVVNVDKRFKIPLNECRR